MIKHRSMNGNVSSKMSNGCVEQNGHHSQEHSDLEESVLSLLSQSQQLSSSTDLATVLSNDYKKSAKAFINKKFDQSYAILTKITSDSIRFYEKNMIDTNLFINIWSLYFNLIDIFVNKGVSSLNNDDLNELNAHFADPDYLFDQLFECEKISPPKLILLLLLIKLNNPQSDLSKLRFKTDLYLVQASSIFNPALNEEEFNDFKELLEVYHIQLMSKLGAYEEAEYLIKENPHLTNEQDTLIALLAQTKIEIEKGENLKKELQKKREEQAVLQQKKEQKIKEQRSIKEKKRKEKKRQEKEESLARERQLSSSSAKNTAVSKSDDVTILNILKNRIMKLKLHRLPMLALIFSLISLFALTKTYSLINANRRLKETLTQVWSKLINTFKMAFQVTYV